MPSHRIDRPTVPLRRPAADPFAENARSNMLSVLIHCDEGPDREHWLKAFLHRGNDVYVESSELIDTCKREKVDAVVAVLRDELEALNYCRGWEGTPAGTLIVITPEPTPTGRKRALLAGADHYFSTAVDPDELVLRVRTHRRRMSKLQSARPAFETRLPFGRFTMNVLSNSVEGPDGTKARLCGLSARLLVAFLQYPGVPLSLSKLGALTSPEGAQPTEHHMRVAIHRLRRQLAGLAPTEPQIINVRGSGYILLSDAQEHEQRDRTDLDVRMASRPSMIANRSGAAAGGRDHEIAV